MVGKRRVNFDMELNYVLVYRFYTKYCSKSVHEIMFICALQTAILNNTAISVPALCSCTALFSHIPAIYIHSTTSAVHVT